MNLRYFFLYISCFFVLNTSTGQYWSKRFDLQMGNERGRKVVLLDEGILLLVNGFCDENTKECLGLLRFDMDGTLQWKTVILDSLEINHGESMEMIKDTIYINTNYLGIPGKNYAILKFDMQGNYISRIDYNYPGLANYHWARDVAASDHRRFITFQYRDSLNGDYLGKIRAFDENWSILWERNIPNIYSDMGWCDTEPTPDNGAVIIYSSCESGQCRANIEKYDSLGGLEWTTTFPKDYYLAKRVELAVHPDGGYVGFWRIDTFGIYVYPNPDMVFKLDVSGQFEWQKVVFNYAQNFSHLFASPNGNILACGVAQDFYQDSINYFTGFIRCYQADGDFKWERKIFDYTEGGIESIFNTGAQIANGDFIFSGEIWDTLSNDPFPGNVWLVKLDSNGCIVPGCGEEQYLSNSQEPAQMETKETFAVFPNPFIDNITLASIFGKTIPPGEYHAKLYNVQGVLLRQQVINPILLTSMDTEGISAGAYLLIVFKDGKVIQTLKVVKK